MDGGKQHILGLQPCHRSVNSWSILKMAREENGNLESWLKVNCMFCMTQLLLHRPLTIWCGMVKANVSRLNALHSTVPSYLFTKSSLLFIRAKDATIIEDDWLDAFIICIEHFTTTSTEEALHDNGMMSFRFRNDKKSLMCLKRLAVVRGI